MQYVTKIKKWTSFELAWISISTMLILALSVMWQDTLLGTLSSLAGIISVVLCAKGKISYLYFGIFQCVTYGFIAYQYQLYGESMLNLLVFLPFNIATIFIWNRHKKDSKKSLTGEEVETKKLTLHQWLIIVPVIVLTIILYAWVLQIIGARQVQLDAVAVILSIFAQILLTMRYVESWLIWNVVNVITVALWVLTLKQTGGNDYGILVMQIAFLINSIYAYWNWLKFTKG